VAVAAITALLRSSNRTRVVSPFLRTKARASATCSEERRAPGGRTIILPISGYDFACLLSSSSTMVTSSRRNPIPLSGMFTKLNSEIVAAAIAGFEEQKERIDAHIAELRNMQGSALADGSGRAPTKRRRLSAAARSRIAGAQRKRWAAARKQAGATSSTAPVRKKRKLSAAGRRAITEATKRPERLGR
jgi:hypothetical protein